MSRDELHVSQAGGPKKKKKKPDTVLEANGGELLCLTGGKTIFFCFVFLLRNGHVDCQT